ncbi:hypothetical protein D1872_267180 [compost metagenome]
MHEEYLGLSYPHSIYDLLGGQSNINAVQHCTIHWNCIQELLEPNSVPVHHRYPSTHFPRPLSSPHAKRIQSRAKLVNATVELRISKLFPRQVRWSVYKFLIRCYILRILENLINSQLVLFKIHQQNTP